MIRTRFAGILTASLVASSSLFLVACASNQTIAHAKAEKETKRTWVGERVEGDLELKRPNGRTVTLEDLYEDRPIVLTFYRGNWCPYCNRALTEWRNKTDELNRAGGQLVAISLENLEEVRTTQEKNDLDYTVLSDYRGQVSNYFDLTFELDASTRSRYAGFGIDLAIANATNDWELPVPGTFVVDTGGVIRYAYNNPNYQVRADPDAVIGVVKRLN